MSRPVESLPPAHRPVVEMVAPAVTGGRTRRRAWLWAVCMLLAAAIYLNVWTTYAIYGLTDYGRFAQQPPGAPVTAMGAEFRLVSMVQTTRLISSIDQEVSRPPVNAAWVVARIDVVPRTEDPDLFCSFQVLGPQRRVWEPDDGFVAREAESTCPPESMEIGRTYPLEVVFQIPDRYLGELAGIAVDDPASRRARPVLVPPA